MVTQSPSRLMKSIMMATTMLSAKPLIAAWSAAVVLYRYSVGDCDDVDERVYPTAPEYCDGQFNDCQDVAYDPLLAPANETDDDADGWVECEVTTGVQGDHRHRPWGDGAHYTDGFGCYCDGPCDDGNKKTLVVRSVLRLFRHVLRLVGMGTVTIQIHGY